MAEKGSFDVVDLLVRLEDQSLVDLEIQKQGYHFLVSRMDCYCSDMIMREYNRLHGIYGSDFNFGMLHPVIAIVLMEHSPEEFGSFPDVYIHRGRTKWDSGLKFNGLFRQVYVCLNKFKRIMQNKVIENPLEAWLTLLTSQDMACIDRLLNDYPEFEDVYRDIFRLGMHRRN